MGHTIVSYLISHGLGPFFQECLIEDVISSEYFYTLHFDETVTNHSRKQLDILIRYFSKTSQTVQVRFVSALFFGHAYAHKVVDELLALLSNLMLPLAKLLTISNDGPNVNTSIKNKLDESVRKEKLHGLVHNGFCVIHMIHNTFKAGNVKFGQRALDLPLDVHQWFHMFPAREECYSELQTAMENQDESDTLKFLRHVDQGGWLCCQLYRWSTNSFHYSRSTSRNSCQRMTNGSKQM